LFEYGLRNPGQLGGEILFCLRRKKMKKVIILVCVSMIATTAFGAGLAGIKDSTEFTNQLGKWPGYANYQYEGGGDDPNQPNVIAQSMDYWDPEKGHSLEYHSSYDTMGSPAYTGTGASGIMNHSSDAHAGNAIGPYKYLNKILAGDIRNTGFTWEFRAKYNTLETYEGLAGPFWGGYHQNWGEDTIRLLGGYYTNPGGDPISKVKFGGEVYNLPGSLYDWRTYRVACLGELDPIGEPNMVTSYLYQDTTYIASTKYDNSAMSSGLIHWMGVNWGWEVSAIDVDLDYYRIDTTGAWAPIPEPATMLILLSGGLFLRRRK
jgi:hypothetical protein